MPWCPNCKTEYQEGFTVCKDCKVELVENLEKEVTLVPFFQSDNKKIADKLVRYFKYSELEAKVEYDENTEMYMILIPTEQENEAKKLYQAFYFVERENLARGIIDDEASDNDENSEDEESSDVLSDETEGLLSAENDSEGSKAVGENEDEDSEADDILDDEEQEATTYVMKADQYKDLAGTVWVFLSFGIIGIIVVLLNIVGLLSFFHGWLPNTLMGALFLFFIYIALSTNQKAKKIQTEIDEENQLTGQINQWLELNVTESFLQANLDDTLSEELNYLKLVATIKEKLITQFGPQNLAYLDRLIEEFYNRTFDAEYLESE